MDTVTRNDIGIVIQARTGSTRLPGKMLMPFYKGKTILELIVSKIKTNFEAVPIVLATTRNPQDDLLEELANNYDVKVYRGDEANVLSRFIEVASLFGFKWLMRVCADNPFLDVNELKRLLSYYDEQISLPDYISFRVNNRPSIKSHFGFWAELVKAKALESIVKRNVSSMYLEHVTNYLYEHPQDYDITLIEPNPAINNRNDIRMTLDTKDDFDILSDIYNGLSCQFPLGFGIDEIVKYIDQEPKIRVAMAEQINNNLK